MKNTAEFDYIEFVLEREDVKSYDDLRKLLGVSSSKVWRSCSRALAANEKSNIKEKLEKEKININNDFSNRCEVLKEIFSMRRRENKMQTKAIRKFDIQDSRILKILAKYPESTIELMEGRCKEKQEFVTFILTFEQFRREFSQYKPKEQKDVIKILFKETKTYSIDEFVLFVNDSNIIHDENDLLKILGKNSFRTLKFNLKKFFPTYNKSKAVEALKAEKGKKSAKVTETPKAEEEPKPAKDAETPKAEEEPKPAEVAETLKAKKAPKPAKVAETPKAEEEPKPAEVAETLKAKKEPIPAKVAETPKAEEEPKPAKVAETTKAEEEPKPAKVAETPKAEEEPKPAKVAETPKVEEEPKPAKVAETPKAEEEPKPAKVAETPKAKEEPKPAKVVEAPKTEENTKSVEVVESASQKKKKSFGNRKFKILDDSIYEWSSGIELAKDATVVAVDTNLLVSKKFRDNITNRFRKIGISSMVMKELRNLAEHKEEARIGINTIANSILNNKGVTKFFPIPDMKVLGRISADLDGDVEIIQAITESSEDAVTFVTADAGAAVYAWSVGCPCRFLKTDLKNTMQKDISCMSDGTAFLDNVYIKNIAQRLGSFSSIVISSEYAKMLNQKKLNHEDIRNFQMAIATDTRRVFIPAKLKSDSRCNRMAYESEVIRLCLEKDYTLVSNNKDFLAYAWSFGVKVSLI